MSLEGFSFTITDAARFLGKSPVTLRKWERDGLVNYSRVGTDRRLDCNAMRSLAQRAYALGRLSEKRLRTIESTLFLLEIIEEGVK